MFFNRKKPTGESRREQSLLAFAQVNLSRCPICRQKDVEWGTEYEEMDADLFLTLTCPHCGCALALSYMDLRGVSDSRVPAFLRTSGNYDAAIRSAYGKRKNVAYIRIRKAGSVPEAAPFEGKILPLDELKDAF